MEILWLLCLLALGPSTPAGIPAKPDGASLSPEALLEYQDKILTVEDELVVVDGDSHRTVAVYQGRYRKRIDWLEFLRLVGQPERADRDQRRLELEIGLFAAGAVALVAGTIIAGEALIADVCHEDVSSPRFGDCVRRNAQRGPSPPPLAVALGVGGLAMLAAPFAIHPSPPSADQMRRMADEYNRALRERLSGTSAPARVHPAVELHAAPYADLHGGGLLVQGTF